MSYELSPEAQSDLVAIAGFIAEDSPRAARKLIADIRRACEKLAGQPGLGHRRKDLTVEPTLRFYAVRRYYLVIYREDTKPLQIVRVLHSARDATAELTGD